MTTDAGFDPVEATVEDVHDAFAAGTLTAVELVDRYLERIEAHDDDLNAVLTTNDGARERAARLDERYAASGPVGPLHGVPVVLKDNQDTHDLPTTAGSRPLAGATPDRDATVVARLREAGAVVLAKANLQELSFGVDTISSLGGATRNAYARDRRPSGSSGGTAAAVAANLALLGTGSDTCSSVRSPPAFASLVGVRPTRGLVSRTGVVPLSETQDVPGPIARTVADAARTLDAMAGYDPADPVTARAAGQVPADGYRSHLDPDGLDGARIGVVRRFFGLQDADSEGVSGADAARVSAVVDDAVAAMADAGATVVDPVDPVDPGRLARARVLSYEFARDLGDYLAGRPEVQYDTLAELVATGEVAPAIESRIREGEILEVDPGTVDEDPEYLRRLVLRRELADETLAAMADDDLDALVYPPSTVPPVQCPAHQPFGELPCELAAHTGFPAVVVPAGFTDEGLPVGVELLGRPFAEPRLFELAYAFERATDHRRPPEAFTP
jgi:Asp-tRNA(Asn)/Glu-tRNA(Gln) amidotransferase A subunit family amidase